MATCTYHMEEITGTALYIYRNDYYSESIRVDERDLSQMV